MYTQYTCMYHLLGKALQPTIVPWRCYSLNVPVSQYHMLATRTTVSDIKSRQQQLSGYLLSSVLFRFQAQWFAVQSVICQLIVKHFMTQSTLARSFFHFPLLVAIFIMNDYE